MGRGWRCRQQARQRKDGIPCRMSCPVRCSQCCGMQVQACTLCPALAALHPCAVQQPPHLQGVGAALGQLRRVGCHQRKQLGGGAGDWLDSQRHLHLSSSGGLEEGGVLDCCAVRFGEHHTHAGVNQRNRGRTRGGWHACTREARGSKLQRRAVPSKSRPLAYHIPACEFTAPHPPPCLAHRRQPPRTAPTRGQGRWHSLLPP